MRNNTLIVIIFTTFSVPLQAQFTLDNTGSYSQNFNNISSGLPTGWDARVNSTLTSLGTSTTFTTTASDWASTTAGFKNMASSTALASNATAIAQSNSTDRAFGIRQTAAFGDPGASFTFRASTSNVVSITGISLDAHMLSVQGRSTTWTVRYALGNDLTTFTTLGTYSDPSTFGVTNLSYTSLTINPDSSNEIYFQVSALTAATGSNNRDSFGIDNFTIIYNPVPEPTSLIALAAAGLGAVALRRRRKVQTA